MLPIKMFSPSRDFFRGGGGERAFAPVEDFVPPRAFFEKQMKYIYTAICLGFLLQISTTLSTMSCGSFSGVSNIYMHIH